MFLRRDSEKSLENWVRMDLNRSLFLYCKKPLVCYPISKWGQLVANSGPLQELQVFSYPAEKEELSVWSKRSLPFVKLF